MKILYLLPHCSTGGMPQYTLKQIQTFKDENDIYVLEHSFYGYDFVVQRRQMEKEAKFMSLYGDEKKLQKAVNSIKPDVIHCQELPESFLRLPNSLQFLYSSDRTWNVVVTTHSSHTTPKDFKFYPDRIITVNNWQKSLLENSLSGVEVDIWEYPIEDLVPTKEEKQSAKENLGFKEGYDKHILNVGLFTPGKNQGELFEIARSTPKNLYHFVGNQASNFSYYWKPLMETIPENCIVWGERPDVDEFYKAADEFYFTSNFELNPLCVKEALSFGLPIKMKKLHTYGADYDNNSLITFI